MGTFRSLVRRVVYGPLTGPVNDPHSTAAKFWVAPVRLDLDDLDALVALFNELTDSRDQSYLAAWQPGPYPPDTPALLSSSVQFAVKPGDIPKLTPTGHASLNITAFTTNSDPHSRIGMGLSDSRPSILHGAHNNIGAPAHRIVADVVGYLERRNVPRHMPVRRRLLALSGLGLTALSALAAWGTTSTWQTSPPTALLLAVLSIVALVGLGRSAMSRYLPYDMTDADHVRLEMISRSEVDRKRRDSFRYRLTVGVAIVAVGIAIAVPFINSALRND